MRALFAAGAIALALLATPARSAVLVDIPMDQQINKGVLTNSASPLGDAIYIPSSFSEQLEFVNDGTDAFTRVKITGGSWWYGPYIDFSLASGGAPLSITDEALIEFDARFFQPESNTNRYGDAPIFLRVYSYLDDNATLTGYRDYSIVHATQAPWNNPPYPTWSRATVDFKSGTTTNTAPNAFDPTRIYRMRMYGTDWFSPAGQYGSFIDVKNFRVTAPDAIPEPGTIALMAMSALPLMGLRRRKA